ELCGLPNPGGLIGRSLVPDLRNTIEAIGARHFALTQTPRPNYPRGKPPTHMGYSMRTDRVRYTEWRKFDSGQVVARELYDHTSDHDETENRVNSFAADQLKLLSEQLQQLVLGRKTTKIEK
ncbi:MAG: iduronate sulfatase, partial [Pirellulales bacterium]|nr:iduronate sulfatase [Pirellulales bacterium]